jgi:hypothetical protein
MSQIKCRGERIMGRIPLLVAALTVVMAASALAADLSDVQGSVLVNNSAVSENTKLNSGDRVKAVSGSAKIVYSNGNVVEVSPGQTVAVTSMKDTKSEDDDIIILPVFLDGSSDIGVIGGGALAGAAGLTLVLTRRNSPPVSP